MPLFKKRLSEQEAAREFILSVVDAAERAWPSVYRSLADTADISGKRFVVDDETWARADLAFAMIAMELAALENLFSREQADRLFLWTSHYLGLTDDGGYAQSEVLAYFESSQQALRSLLTEKDALANDPLSAIPGRLLERWLGPRINEFVFFDRFSGVNIIDPLFLGALDAIITERVGIGRWKRINEQFTLFAGNPPPDSAPDSGTRTSKGP